MSISLSDDTRRLIEERMKQGGYTSADELIRDVLGGSGGMAIEPLDEETLNAIDRAEEQIQRGQFKNVHEVIHEWRQRRGTN